MSKATRPPYDPDKARRLNQAFDAIVEALRLPVGEHGEVRGMATEGDRWLSLSVDVAEQVVDLLSKSR